MITSASNSRILAATRLRSRRHRQRTGTFLIDGIREISRAHDSGVDLIEIYGPPGTDPDMGTFHEMGGAALEKLTYGDRSDGLVAVARAPDLTLERIRPTPTEFVLVAADIEKPGNLGAILRTADAVGVDTAIITDRGSDPWNPNVIRSSTGAVFTVPLAVADGAEIRRWLRHHAIDILATSPDATASIWEREIPTAVAVVVGAEDRGLGPEWFDDTDPVTIPMWGGVDSLNTSVAAALVLYEVARRRRT